MVVTGRSQTNEQARLWGGEAAPGHPSRCMFSSPRHQAQCGSRCKGFFWSFYTGVNGDFGEVLLFLFKELLLWAFLLQFYL